jgi:hopanoid biosynthesis associated RND transporter like protein HpnN
MAACALAVVGLGITTQLQFDFDPLNLKDPTTESVSTMFDVMKDPDSGTYAIEVLRQTLKEAEALAEQASKLPEVDHAMTLASFVPENQKVKLSMISDARMLLDPTLSLPLVPPPTKEENLAALQKLSVDLHTVGKTYPSAERLAVAVDDVVRRQDDALIQRLNTNLISVMQIHLAFIKSLLVAEPVTVDSITDDLRRDWVTTDGRFRVQIHPKGNPRIHAKLIAFTKAVRTIAPDATGTPISIQESGKTVTMAFIQAGLYALIAIALLAFVILRRVLDVLFMLAPLILAGILTLATIVAIDLPLNFANIIALPLLLSLGVSYAIYFVSFARSGHNYPLQSSMARAVLFSAATVLVAFGSLALSSHPGTSGMGELLTVALVYSLLSTFLLLPALLGSHKPDK